MRERSGPVKQGEVPLKAKEGYFIVLPLTNKNYADMLSALGKPEWKEKYPLNVKGHFEAWDALMAALEDWAKDYTAEEVERILGADGCPVTRFLTMEESMNLPQVAARESQVIVNDGRGAYKVPNTPLRATHSHARVSAMVAEYGQHNQEIFGGLLGLGDAEIARLREAGVIHGA